jgi:cell division inhibitor SepF
MPLLNKGAIANFFGLADEEEYDFNDYSEATQKTAVQAKPAAQPKVQTKAQPVKTQVKAQPAKQPVQSRPQRPAASAAMTGSAVREEYVQPVEKKKVIELRQAPSVPVQKEEVYSKRAVQSQTNAANKITILEPRAYSEAMTIAKKVIAGEAVLVNFHLVEEKQARRIVDFLTGTVYALDGDIKRVGDEIFLCTPTGVEIDSSTAQSFADANIFDL